MRVATARGAVNVPVGSHSEGRNSGFTVWDDVDRRIATVRFILPHLGAFRSDPYPAHIEAIDLVKRHPNIHIETSGIPEHKYLEMRN
jgi:predicted TIM-barrel fold metal-dependent hydrolase